MSDQVSQTLEENAGSSSPDLFEDSQNANANETLELLDSSKNESKETLFGGDADISKDDSPIEDSPKRPVHNLFGSQQNYIREPVPSTSSPLRYPLLSPHSSLSLSKMRNGSAHRLDPIDEDSPNASMTTLEDGIGSFGSLSGVSAELNTPPPGSTKSILSLKRKIPADISSDSDLEILSTSEKKIDSSFVGSQEEVSNKKSRPSIECVYASTPHRSGSSMKIPPFQTSDVSELRSIPEEMDTGDDLGHLHFSPSQDNDKSNGLAEDKTIEDLKKLNPTNQENSPNSGSDSNSIFSQVNKMVTGTNSEENFSGNGSVTISDEKKISKDDDEDTIELENSDAASPELLPLVQNNTEDAKPVVTSQKGKEGFVFVKISYDVSDNGKIMENVKLLWQTSVIPEIICDVSSSVRTSNSPLSQSSNHIDVPFSFSDKARGAARPSIVSSSSSSSGGSMLPPILKLPASAFKFLNQKVVLKQDPQFRADELLKIAYQLDDVTKPTPSSQEAVTQTKDELNLETPSATSVLSGSKTRSQRSRKKGSARSSAKSKAVKTRSIPQRKRLLNQAGASSDSPGVMPFAESAGTPAQVSNTLENNTENHIAPEETMKLSQASSIDDTSTSKITLGKVVFARWSDGSFYSGKVGTFLNDRWEIHFDDGGKLPVREDGIVVVDKIPVGQPVLAALQPYNYYPGVVYGHNESKPGEILYTVDLDKKGQHEFTKAQLCLTFEQMNTLRTESSQNMYLVTPPRNLDVSLDNMIEGKRSRSKRHLEMNNSTTSSVGKTSRTEPKPGCSKSDPNSYSRAAFSENDTETELDSFWHSDWESITGVEECAWPPSENKKKSNTGNSKLGPYPKSKLFEGYYFSLCFCSGGLDSGSQSEVSEVDSQEEDKLVFDRIHLTQQLRKGGGTVVEFFEMHQLKQHIDKCFLITNRHNTSAKSIMCLSLGIKSVKYTWVIHSCILDKCLPVNSFYLPVGKSLQSYKNIEWSERPKNAKPFKNLRIAILSDLKDNFVNFWKKVLAHEDVAHIFTFTCEEFVQTGTKDWFSIINADCVVTDNANDDEVIQAANNFDVPLVRTSWLVQCLIEGNTVPCAMHQFNTIKNKTISEMIQVNF